MTAGRSGAVAFARVQDAPLSVDEVMAAVRHDRAGAVALFVGQVRDHDGGRGVAALDYSAHPSADSVAATIAARYAALPGIERIALAHRVGALVVGDLAIVAAVSSAHRGAAFQTCADLVEDVKAHLPIWKHQQFEDGTQEWVGIE
ncbi:MAG: molybdenum cofactor biosynthesis protein MoaE [Actinomycetales bacterium]|jgi:molybdopterin synthase catalytic subunit|nr:molybdenum cofactor biosynthesis protein MoaE [Candidatus Phosphoribacter baldrii]MBK6954759.1 molybdenum cofactor biosynthesis protein MoaE [Candidatus Phosphoribacter baldrii]